MAPWNSLIFPEFSQKTDTNKFNDLQAVSGISVLFPLFPCCKCLISLDFIFGLFGHFGLGIDSPKCLDLFNSGFLSTGVWGQLRPEEFPNFPGVSVERRKAMISLVEFCGIVILFPGIPSVPDFGNLGISKKSMGYVYMYLSTYISYTHWLHPWHGNFPGFSEIPAVSKS